ncbi:uncharacterized protein LOC21407350 [Morus notabilis]|uniref:uncharacterized protein LOC21407350 n=1 Tax=Morus notabilis TaxID=981085 RepID=UPI000CECE749|nr:uncharacterized protein LOC21407350 [Morus notabilis]
MISDWSHLNADEREVSYYRRNSVVGGVPTNSRLLHHFTAATMTILYHHTTTIITKTTTVPVIPNSHHHLLLHHIPHLLHHEYSNHSPSPPPPPLHRHRYQDHHRDQYGHHLPQANHTPPSIALSTSQYHHHNQSPHQTQPDLRNPQEIHRPLDRTDDQTWNFVELSHSRPTTPRNRRDPSTFHFLNSSKQTRSPRPDFPLDLGVSTVEEIWNLTKHRRTRPQIKRKTSNRLRQFNSNAGAVKEEGERSDSPLKYAQNVSPDSPWLKPARPFSPGQSVQLRQDDDSGDMAAKNRDENQSLLLALSLTSAKSKTGQLRCGIGDGDAQGDGDQREEGTLHDGDNICTQNLCCSGWPTSTLGSRPADGVHSNGLNKAALAQKQMDLYQSDKSSKQLGQNQTLGGDVDQGERGPNHISSRPTTKQVPLFRFLLPTCTVVLIKYTNLLIPHPKDVLKLVGVD